MLSVVSGKCRKYNVYLEPFITSFVQNDVLDRDAASFLHYLVHRIRSTSLLFPDVPDAAEIPNSYNPPKNGCFYYFNPNGSRIRNNRPFSIDEEGNTVHDDEPTTSSCSKKYPNIAKRGTSFIFL